MMTKEVKRKKCLVTREWATTNLSAHLEPPKDKALALLREDAVFNGLTEDMYETVEWEGSTDKCGAWFLLVDSDIYALVMAWRGIDLPSIAKRDKVGSIVRTGAIPVEIMKHLVGIYRGERK